ncbi:MAG: SRPBCC family protein [Mycobacterium sp.]
MPTVSRTFTVKPPPKVVLGYLEDFSHAQQWDPGTQHCTRIGADPVGVGTQWHNKSKILGVSTELEYTLLESKGDRVVFEGKNKSSTTVDTIVVTPAQSGSRIEYRADLRMHGLSVLATPMMKLVFEKLAGDTESQMIKVLNDLPADEVNNQR